MYIFFFQNCFVGPNSSEIKDWADDMQEIDTTEGHWDCDGKSEMKENKHKVRAALMLR